MKTIAAARAQTFAYERTELSAGIVHLGVGAFHRAHQAVYVDDILAQNPDWAIVGASLRSSSAAEALNPQDGLYSLTINGSSESRSRIVGSLLEVIDASAGPEVLLQRMADPATRIVSLTITEKGYCIDPATGRLDRKHPDIAADLETPGRPCSAIGIIVEALRLRKLSGAGPFTVLCCDNLPENGRVTRNVVTEMASLQDAVLSDWIENNATFPSTMVDRIVPATTKDDTDAVNAGTGVVDAAPVVTEPFSQWVVEDRFCAGRPPWEDAGVTFVDDVRPFEEMKLRLLNGSHSTLAYLGYLAGHETVADAIGDPELHALVHDMMTLEVIPTLEMPTGVDLFAYRDALLHRFANRSLKHRTWQIAMDGSQKLPQRLLSTIQDRLAAGQPIDRLVCGVAGWMRYVTGTDMSGNPIDVRDPLADELKVIGARAGNNSEKLVKAYAGVGSVFGPDLVEEPVFLHAVTQALENLNNRWKRQTSD
ncbi:MAG: mannitol dehydrogenase family protein [Anderseniella sp.]